MARDKEKYAYFPVGIPRDSDTYRKLMKDAENTGSEISRLIVTRLSDYYAGIHSAAPVVQEPEVKQPPASAKSNALASMDEW